MHKDSQSTASFVCKARCLRCGSVSSWGKNKYFYLFWDMDMYDDESGTKKMTFKSRITLNHGNYLSDYLQNLASLLYDTDNIFSRVFDS